MDGPGGGRALVPANRQRITGFYSVLFPLATSFFCPNLVCFLDKMIIQGDLQKPASFLTDESSMVCIQLGSIFF
jgi:hypothetical protein